MAPVKGPKNRKSNRSDAGNYTCDVCGEEVHNRGCSKHKCKNTAEASASLGEVLKQMAQDEAYLNKKCMLSRLS